MKNPVCFLVFILFLVSVSVQAQTANQPKTFGAILYAEGDEFTIYRGSVLSSYSVISDNISGMQLLSGDLVQTGSGTFLEIQLIPSQTIVKIAENTSFRLATIAQPGGTAIDILYGRILAKVDKTLGVQGFSIRGKTAVAGVRGTEFGYDVVAIPGLGTEPSSQVYCYSGSVNVQPIQTEDPASSGTSDPSKTPPSYDIKANQMASVYDANDEQTKKIVKPDPAQDTVSSQGKRTVVLSKVIKNPIKNFWKNKGIKSTPLDQKAIDEKYFGKKSTGKPEKPETVSKNDLPELSRLRPAATHTNLADSIEPLGTLSPLTTMSVNQYVLAPDGLKIAGLLLTLTGLATDLLGITLYTFGDDFGASEYVAHSSGAVTLGIGAVLSISGVVTYILGLTK